MVKIENPDGIEDTLNGHGMNSSLLNDSSKVNSCSVPVAVKEESLPSSSSSHLKQCLVGMGFSSILVDKVIEENGEVDVNILLEALLAYSHAAYQKSSPASEFRSGFSGSYKVEDSSPFELSSGDNQDKKDHVMPLYADVEKRSYLLMMDFTEDEIDLAMNCLGVSSSTGDIVDFIIACQTAKESEEKEMLDSISCEGNNESTIEALFGTMDKTLCLLRMGFTENEVSTAIAKFGSDAPLNELADSILTSRFASPVKEEYVTEDEVRFTCQGQNEFEQLGRRVKEDFPVDFSPPKDPPPPSPPPPPPPPSFRYEDDEDKKSVKKAKFVHLEDKATASSSSGYYPESVKEEESDDVPRNIAAGHVKNESGSPFFFYGNVADVSQETWRKLSRFLFGTEPEFANSQFFSAFIRKEGYLHNLPTGGRFKVLPKPPMTIEGVLPHTTKWWPSWDTRKQLSCINSATEGLSRICDRLGRLMAASHGLPSKEQQMDILHHCRALNLVWTGPYELRPVDPEHLECILGYPKDHTDGSGFDLGGRLAALYCSFQTDTIGYLLSTLKGVFPGGLRLLSLCSGIGGAEVALHRLGIRLRCVVSVESSENNRRAMRRWWSRAGQTGKLRQIAGLEKLTVRLLESLWKEFGGFDLIVGGNPGNLASATGGCCSAMDLNHFYEFARVLQRMRSLMGRNTTSLGRWNQ